MASSLRGLAAIPKASISKKDKFRAVQILRAIAATLVVYVHAMSAVASQGTPAQARFFYLENFGAVGVDIFFVISGFVISRSVARHPHWFDFLGRRALRIYPLYWLLTAISALVVQKSVDAGTLARSLLFIPPLIIALGWTLGFEMLFYVMLSLQLAISARRALIGTILTFCGLIAVRQIFGSRLAALNLIGNPVIVEFLVGVGIGIAFSKFGSSRKWGITATLVGAALLLRTIVTGYGNIGAAHYTVNGSESWHRLAVWGAGAGLLVGGVVFWTPAITSLFGRFLAFLGDASYSIYLFSWVALNFVSRKPRYFTFLGADAGVIFATCFSVASATGVYLFVEKPMTEFFQRTWKRTMDAKLSRPRNA